ncbi:MAG: T9SS type A sorting domain-containing protein [Prevotellaceae bacterium]|nr:T9SS type A sorting domain-containing protein [Prevotellaceae bacterium]
MNSLAHIFLKKLAIVTLCLTSFCAVFCTVACAERIRYGYDAAGNRVLRQKEIVMQAKPKAVALDSISQDQVEDLSAPTQFEEMISDVKIIIYPNPTQGALRIEILGIEVPKDAQIYLHSISGTIVRRWIGISNDNTMDITAQPAGIYIMRIVLDRNRVSSWKIIKQ